jgi:hypothetical protein
MDGMKVLKTIRTTDKTLYVYDKTIGKNEE